MKDILFEDFEVAMKVVIVGNGSVGKSSMIQRYCRGIFTRDYKKTIGVDFLERVLSMDDQQIRLMLWDTAGQEEFDAITRTYYRGAHACVIACSVTDRESFLALPKWKSKVAKECGDIPMVLVANKTDLQKQAVIDSSELESMAKSLGITTIFRTSVKEDTNVNSVFNHLAKTYMTMMSALDDESDEIGPDDNDGNLLLKNNYESKSHRDNHQNNTSTFSLFGKKSRKSSSKAAKQGANNNNVHQSMNNGNGFTEKPTYFPPPPVVPNSNSQNQLNKQNNPAVQFKGILRTPVINATTKPSNGHGDFTPRHHHGQAVNIFTGGHKNKLIFSSPHVPSNNSHLHNGSNNHVSNGRKNIGNGITLERYSYGSAAYGGKAMLAAGGGHHAVPRWTDMSKYDNMPFRLDLGAPPKKHHKRALCNIL